METKAAVAVAVMVTAIMALAVTAVATHPQALAQPEFV
jgi:hypothetical protein